MISIDELSAYMNHICIIISKDMILIVPTLAIFKHSQTSHNAKLIDTLLTSILEAIESTIQANLSVFNIKGNSKL